MKNDYLGGFKHICPVCGKKFWATSEWVYKNYSKYSPRKFCSWTCLRADEKSTETLADKIRQAFCDGLTDAEIQKKLCLTKKQLVYWKNNTI